ncbi:molybdate ABC transporter substrate-binding protein [Desulfallas sp. Bu1-1]|uniref:molybdate ABC transporter substrate-binding protein n=1 Tax=Desulfallas sp. Bu1-1 TaxID=2787620 RepID=UPI0018A0F9EE|nr:molybdate ABC transporter substrate-binding protein [Desulfallas sp. Bu1-1]MBF7084601.1 molybdate ABC transporter substrate-binding protein [Desulfallas sp. Bu1-1]
MKVNFKLIPMMIIILTTVLLGGCGQEVAAPGSGEKEPVSLTVSAAGSLTDAIKEVINQYENENQGVNITLNLGSSGSLQQQIEQGAPVDVFISAAAEQMNALQDKGLILPETRVDVLENSVVLVVPGDSTIDGFDALLSGEVKQVGMGEPESVPAGRYGKEVLTHLGLWDKLQSKLVFAKDVRQVLNWVQTKNVDAGIVYLTDAKLFNDVKVVAAAPADSHSPVVYPAAVVKATKQTDAAKAFVNYLTSDKALEIFEKYGFSRAVN